MSEPRLILSNNSPDVLIQDGDQSIITEQSQCGLFADLAYLDGRGTGDLILPRGTRYIERRGNLLFTIYEFTPRLWSFKTTIYDTSKDLRISLPYILLINCFFYNGNIYRWLPITQSVFVNHPFCSLDDQTNMAMLLNTARDFGGDRSPHGKNFFCTGRISDELVHGITNNLVQPIAVIPNYIKEVATSFVARSFNNGIAYLRTNYGSFANSIKDIYPLDTWEKNSLNDPELWRKINWIPNGMTVRDVLDDVRDSLTFNQHINSAYNLIHNDYGLSFRYVTNHGA